LAFADGLLLLAKNEESMKETMKRLERIPKKQKLATERREVENVVF